MTATDTPGHTNSTTPSTSPTTMEMTISRCPKSASSFSVSEPSVSVTS